MTITEMHVWFRQYAQQMGMQNVRAILPEQIDLLINTSITDTVNQIVRENIGITNDRVITDNSKIGQINALRTLYKVYTIDFKEKENPQAADSTAIGPAVHELSDGKITLKCQEYTNKTFTAVGQASGIGKNEYSANIPEFVFLVDFSINYTSFNLSPKGGSTPVKSTTRYFPVRIIDDAYLADTLNDFVLSPRYRSPIITIYRTPDYLSNDTGENTNKHIETSIFDLYFGIEGENITLRSGNELSLNTLRMSYISKPAEVAYRSDIEGSTQNVNCDLPESMHIDILKHAVDLYRTSISGNTLSQQSQEQAQQQELARNNYRNEGYQQ